jgi:CelD/BcsL family acetyltransferase involved in cellulose biosynthesis
VLNVTVVPVNQLTPAHLSTWTDLQNADPTLDSPYFRPEFTQAVAAVRDDVEVAILEEHGSIVGFFPFQRGSGGKGRPAGGPMSGFHGVIARQGLVWDPRELIRACRLAVWSFDDLPVTQTPFLPYHYGVTESGFMDLANGFEAYKKERRGEGSEVIKKTMKKWRKLEREEGPIRFVPHTTDPAVFEALKTWKSAQYERTGAVNIFSFGWTLQLLERILASSDPTFGGMLSALYVGDRLIAAEYGMRSHGVLQRWFPAYDTELGQYSPGMILVLELARSAESLGLKRFDLGKGNPYLGPDQSKTSFMTGSIQVAQGSVSRSALAHRARRWWFHARGWLRNSPLSEPLRRWSRPVRAWLTFR